ncbi:hypothetical protein K3495_g15700 [Podosphaera aphanis]|nr:hypothetical protein K3495_g15700 [Podosphaera aphanis]
MRHLHKRFGHPAVRTLHKVLTEAGHDAKYEALEAIQKWCNHFQMKGSAPRRFRFKLNDKAKDFNAECEADIFYIDGKPVLHVVCVITGFGNGRWLTDGRSSEEVLEALLV